MSRRLFLSGRQSTRHEMVSPPSLDFAEASGFRARRAKCAKPKFDVRRASKLTLWEKLLRSLTKLLTKNECNSSPILFPKRPPKLGLLKSAFSQVKLRSKIRTFEKICEVPSVRNLGKRLHAYRRCFCQKQSLVVPKRRNFAQHAFTNGAGFGSRLRVGGQVKWFWHFLEGFAGKGPPWSCHALGTKAKQQLISTFCKCAKASQIRATQKAVSAELIFASAV